MAGIFLPLTLERIFDIIINIERKFVFSIQNIDSIVFNFKQNTEMFELIAVFKGKRWIACT